jgi:tetratricopeptide (TPR) repeat protein
LPLACDTQPDVWRQVESVAEGSTVTFIPLRALTAADADELVREDLGYEDKKRVFESRIRSDGPAHAWRYQTPLCLEAMRAGDDQGADSLRGELDRTRAADPQAAKHISVLFDQYRLETGWRLLIEGRRVEALALADQIEPASSFRYPGLVLASSAARQAQQLARADAALVEARRLDPSRFDARLETAWLRLAQGRSAEGVAEVDGVLRSEPGPSSGLLPSFHRVHSLLLASQGRLSASLAANERFLALAPDNCPGLIDRARILKAMGRLAEARESIQLALSQDPGSGEASDLLVQLDSAPGH